MLPIVALVLGRLNIARLIFKVDMPPQGITWRWHAIF
jgi:hypothetical protein